MGKRKTTTVDRVVLARQRADSAPDNSKAYDKAWATIISGLATTPEGLLVKLEVMRNVFASGDTISGDAVWEMFHLHRTIHESVEALMHA